MLPCRISRARSASPAPAWSGSSTATPSPSAACCYSAAGPDILGRRRVFIAGIVLFSLASLLGGFATTQAWLLAARAVQGAGAAIVAPSALALISTTFPEGPPRNRAMGVYSAMSMGGAAVGLLAGGLLTTYLSWRWVMFVNVPIGIAVALIAPRVLAESPRGAAGSTCPARSPARSAWRRWSTA